MKSLLPAVLLIGLLAAPALAQDGLPLPAKQTRDVTVTGRVELERAGDGKPDRVYVVGYDDKRVQIASGELARQMSWWRGEHVELSGRQTGDVLRVRQVIEPRKVNGETAIIRDEDTLELADGTRVSITGPCYRTVRLALGRKVAMRGWLFHDRALNPRQMVLERLRARVVKADVLTDFLRFRGRIRRGETVWVGRYAFLGHTVEVLTARGEVGYALKERVVIGSPAPAEPEGERNGIVEALGR